MKNKYYFLAIILFFLATYSFAQKSKRGFEFTFKIGPTLANQYGDAASQTNLNGYSPETFYANDPASSKIKIGMNIGGLVEYRFNRWISLGLGVNYIQKGSRINATTYWDNNTQQSVPVTGNIKWIQDYWTIDLPLKVYFLVKQNEIYLLGGLTYGHLIRAKEQGSVTILGNQYEYTNNRGANTNEVGFLLGTGFSYLLHKQHYLIIEFVWNRSLINSYGGMLIPNPQLYYNQTFNFSVGYKFYLKK